MGDMLPAAIVVSLRQTVNRYPITISAKDVLRRVKQKRRWNYEWRSKTAAERTAMDALVLRLHRGKQSIYRTFVAG